MKRNLSLEDIFASVEFELLQSTLLQDELSDGIRELRAYQNRSRAQLLGNSAAAPTTEQLLDLQMRLNEMLLTIIEVQGQKTLSLHQTVKRMGQMGLASRLAANADRGEIPGEPMADGAETFDPAGLADLGGGFSEPSFFAQAAEPFGAGVGNAGFGNAAGPLQDPDALKLAPDIRAVGVPIIGGFLSRLRTALHELVLFYVNRLGERQTEVNLHLAQQQAQIQRTLAAQNALLQRLHNKLEKPANTEPQATAPPTERPTESAEQSASHAPPAEASGSRPQT